MPEHPPTIDRFATPPPSRSTKTPAPTSAASETRPDEFPRWVRLVLYFVGWLLVLVGVAALFLPGPGTLGIALGAAVLSIASEALHERLRVLLVHVWPQGSDYLERFRGRVGAWVSRWKGR